MAVDAHTLPALSDGWGAPAGTHCGLNIQCPELISKAGKRVCSRWNSGSLGELQLLGRSPISVPPNPGSWPRPSPSSPQSHLVCPSGPAAFLMQPGWGDRLARGCRSLLIPHLLPRGGMSSPLL